MGVSFKRLDPPKNGGFPFRFPSSHAQKGYHQKRHAHAPLVPEKIKSRGVHPTTYQKGMPHKPLNPPPRGGFTKRFPLQHIPERFQRRHPHILQPSTCPQIIEHTNISGKSVDPDKHTENKKHTHTKRGQQAVIVFQKQDQSLAVF